MKFFTIFSVVLAFSLLIACNPDAPAYRGQTVKAADLLANPDHLAFSYGGYRHNTRTVVPSVAEIKEDMKILAALGTKLVRTYNTQQFEQAARLLEAIRQLKDEDPDFEMYVMLGAWIECAGAWTEQVDHNIGHRANNEAEIAAAVKLATTYPDIVKIIAVGNEAMVHWAASYFVYPATVLEWVNHLQGLKKAGTLPAEIWITSSDNFASWGGGDDSYHTDDLTALLQAVDYVSLHTYPFHDTHYQPAFWKMPDTTANATTIEQTDAAMLRAKHYAQSQYQQVAAYMKSLGIDKPIHVGETGWATIAGDFYNANGSKAADEYKQKKYYQHMRDWSQEAGISCFYFEAFDESWKDAVNPQGSENHFGLITLDAQVKYALWESVDNGTFEGLTRSGQTLSKSYGGDEALLLQAVLPPPLSSEKANPE